MATDVHIGCTLHAGALTEEVEITQNIEEKVLKDHLGVNARVKAINPTKDFSVKGHGTLTATLGIGSAGISSITTGISVIKQIKYTEKHDDYDGWTYNGTNHPSAQSVT